MWTDVFRFRVIRFRVETSLAVGCEGLRAPCTPESKVARVHQIDVSFVFAVGGKLCPGAKWAFAVMDSAMPVIQLYVVIVYYQVFALFSTAHTLVHPPMICLLVLEKPRWVLEVFLTNVTERCVAIVHFVVFF